MPINLPPGMQQQPRKPMQWELDVSEAMRQKAITEEQNRQAQAAENAKKAEQALKAQQQLDIAKQRESQLYARQEGIAGQQQKFTDLLQSQMSGVAETAADRAYKAQQQQMRAAMSAAPIVSGRGTNFALAQQQQASGLESGSLQLGQQYGIQKLQEQDAIRQQLGQNLAQQQAATTGMYNPQAALAFQQQESPLQRAFNLQLQQQQAAAAAEEARKQREFQEEQGEENRKYQLIGSVLGTAGAVGGAFMGKV